MPDRAEQGGSRVIKQRPRCYGHDPMDVARVRWTGLVALCVAASLAHAAPAPPRNASPRHFEDITGDLPDEPITAVAVDPNDDQVLYAGTDGFLFKSDDGGESWRPILSFPRGTTDDAADATNDDDRRDATSGLDVPDGLDTADPAAGGPSDPDRDDATLLDREDAENATDEPLLSDDVDDLPAGSNDVDDVTVLARGGPGVRAIAFVPGTPGVFYVATPHGLYRTTTAGSSFTRLELALEAENDVRDVAIDPLRPSRLYLATRNGLVVSKDGGQTFATEPGRAWTTPATSVAVENTPEGVLVLVGTEAGLFRSPDGGETFLEVLLRGVPPFAPIAAVAVTADNGTYYAGTSAGLFVGERSAALLERYDGVPSILVQALSPDPARVRALALGTRSRGVLFSSDAGLTLDAAEQVPANEVLGIARGKKLDDVVVATDRGLFRSVPGTGVTISSSALKKLREMWAKEPSLEDVARRALRWNALDPTTVSDMRGRAAFAKWLPRASAKYQITVGQKNRKDELLFRGSDELPPGIDPDNDTTDLFGNVGAFVLQPENGTTQIFWVSLQWDLDRIILNEDEIAAARRTPLWWSAQRRVLDQVQTAWGARRRLMTEVAVERSGRGARALHDDVIRQLRIDELTAMLDAATGGMFTGSTQETDR
jgi:photosystem II stability/assembly factor-like uncharacterized protein